MDRLLELLSPHFLLQHALYGSVIVGFVCPLVGVYFLLRRLVFWGIALPEVSAAGIAFAFMLQGFGLNLLAGSEAGERHLAIVGSVAFTAAAILSLILLDARGKGSSEGRVGALYVAAGAASVLFLVWNASGESEMLELLKGEIVAISDSDFHAILGAFGLAALCLVLFQRELLLVSFDRDMAVALGRKAALWDAFLYVLVGVTISLGVMTVGPLVIFGFLVVPPMAALGWARGMRSFSFLASLIGGASAFAGFYLSFRWDLPLGPVEVGVACAALLVSSALRRATADRP